MSQGKPSIPKGTRDFGPDKMLRRNHIINTIKKVYQIYGFLPLETPSMENLSVLTGKYGDEGDQLIFKVLNSGDFLANVKSEQLNEGYKKLTPSISEKALRYDLTVPFARYVAMNRHELNFPFRRYQIQPVWRADRPQKGRYREFYQCDADVVGTDSLVCEAEILCMLKEVFEQLGIKAYAVKLNNRKLLAAIAEVCGHPGKETDLCVAIDKLDKTSKEEVFKELNQKGFSEKAINKLQPLFDLKGNNAQKLKQLETFLQGNSQGEQGIQEIREIFTYYKNFTGNTPDEFVEVDFTLARGLGYYTGAILEVKALNVSIGSISGGGRYDNLTGVFGQPNLSGVGISFGIDRIYDVMEELGLFTLLPVEATKVLICHFDDESLAEGQKITYLLRLKGIYSEVYPEVGKIKKQLSYADGKHIPYAIIIGSDEIKNQRYTLKNLILGTQEALDFDGIIKTISS
ncbi:MAG TPA: histidine--tRNA ligase [Cytophagaceae bacterium]|jgi:histidyl-tRNA synthetase|nr:histidine--tRNA ligase [Cytophagaceae bacterium]